MVGRKPKDPALKQNRQKHSTKATLPADLVPITKAPRLPPHPDGDKWHEQALFFWDVVWRSPMASQYTEADIPGIVRMAVLTHAFMARGAKVSISAELRQLSSNYGLSPMDRRRLQWTIAKTEDAVESTEYKRARRARKPVIGSDDPREVLDS